MADKTVTVQEPNTTTRRPTLTVDPDGTVHLLYQRGGHSYTADIVWADLPATTRTGLVNAFNALLPVALARFRRTDGGDNAGF